jgi:hypothetical protein
MIETKPSHKGIPFKSYIAKGWTEAQLIADGYDPRPVIRISGGALFENVTSIAKVLAEKNIVFLNFSQLGMTESLRPCSPSPHPSIIVEPKVSWDRATPAWLRRVVMKHFRFEKFHRPSNSWSEEDCPKEYASLLVKEARLFFTNVNPDDLWLSLDTSHHETTT